jgi:hypothetical protein
MAEPRLDWSTARVRDAKLTVEIDGEFPSGWKRTFAAVARLLDRGEWEDVVIKKHQLRVGGVTPGGEEKLQHFLESVIQQTNTDHGVADAASHDRDQSDDDEEHGAEADEGSSDVQMTEQFREFADTASDTPRGEGSSAGQPARSSTQQ